MKRVVIDIRASKNISGLVKVTVTSPAGLMKFFLNVEPCIGIEYVILSPRSCPGLSGNVCGSVLIQHLISELY